jgi:putative hydrolase of the HAD superfamily
MGLKAVIFDFDGLLLDTEWAAFSAWNHIYGEYGHELQLEKWVLCVGSGYHLFDPVKELEALSGLTLDAKELLARKEKIKKDACSVLPLMVGAKELMYKAKKAGFKIGLASSSFRSVIQAHLSRLEIDSYFDVTVTGDEVARIKPHPDLYEKCATLLGVRPINCLVFEDSLNGVRAAKNAGMRCIAVPNRVTRGLDFSIADRVIDGLDSFQWSLLDKHFWD